VIGLFLRESIFVHQALAEITPLRDVFATLFFVSLGMLLSPQFVLTNWPMVVLAVVAIIAIKFAVCFGVTKLFGYSGRTAIFVGFGLIQTGEFGFILAEAGLDAGIIPESFYSLIIAVTVITMLLTPLLLSLASIIKPKKTHEPVFGDMIYSEVSRSTDVLLPRPVSEIVIFGCGRVGRNIVKSLHELNIPYLIIEANPVVVSELHREGHPCIYGDASNTHVLSLACLEKAKVLVVTFPDPLETIRSALRINPKLKVITRVQRSKESERLEQLGVKDLISPEYEASFEFTRRTLARIGWDKKRVREAMNKLWEEEEIPLFSDTDDRWSL
jgi:CPA2 family monovalent cation:H+ antiporter-2